MRRAVKIRLFCVMLCILTASLMMTSTRGVFEAMTPHGQNVATVLRLSCYAAPAHPSTMTAKYFASLVDDQTGGRIRIQVVPSGELGGEVAAMEQMSFGGIAFAIVNCLSMEDKMLAAGGDGTLVPDRSALGMQRIDMLCSFAPDYRCIANSKELIASDAQCAGLNVGAHTTGILTEKLGALGMNALPYAGDVVGSVHYGYLDALELPLMVYATENYDKTLPYLSIFSGPASPDVLLASQVSMGGLSAEDQRVVRLCAAKAAQYQKTILQELQNRAVASLRAKSVRFYPPEMANLPVADWARFQSRMIGGGMTNE